MLHDTSKLEFQGYILVEVIILVQNYLYKYF